MLLLEKWRWPWVKDTPSSDKGNSAADQVILFLINLVSRQDLIAPLARSYESARIHPEDERELLYIPLYLNLEKFVLNAQEPIVKKKYYTAESLRVDIKSAYPIDQLGDEFRLFFLNSSQQVLLLFELGVRDLAHYILESVGLNVLQRVVIEATRGTILDQVYATSQGINFESVNHLDFAFAMENVEQAFHKLNNELYHIIHQTFGEQVAARVWGGTSLFIQSTYGNDMLLQVKRITPYEYINSKVPIQ